MSRATIEKEFTNTRNRTFTPYVHKEPSASEMINTIVNNIMNDYTSTLQRLMKWHNEGYQQLGKTIEFSAGFKRAILNYRAVRGKFI